MGFAAQAVCCRASSLAERACSECRRSTVALVLLAVCGTSIGVVSTASAQANLVELTSHAGYSSAMYNAGTALSESISPSLADWDAKGRHGRSDTGPLPTTPFFAQDMAQGWSEFGQVDANGVLHSFAQAGGYYLSEGGATFAETRVTLRNHVRVTNNGSSVNYFSAAYASHGFLLSGGFGNNVTAYAQETAIIKVVYTAVHDTWGCTGAAQVFGAYDEPTIQVSDDWAGLTTPVARSVANFSDPIHGIELSLLRLTKAYGLNPGEYADLELQFEGSYGAVSSLADSGFLSLGLADFSGTGSFTYMGYDGTTGLPTNDISFELIGIPAPGAGALGFVMVGAGIVRHRRMRAG